MTHATATPVAKPPIPTQDQRERWNETAVAWHRWYKVLDHGSRACTDRMLHLAQLEAGHQVLDIATGTGEPAISAARRVAPGGRVVAIDASERMLDFARLRAAERQVNNIVFRCADAGNLADDAKPIFDAVLSRFGLMLLPDIPTTLQRLRGVLRPGGRFVAAVWDVPQRVPMISLSARVARRFADFPNPGPTDPGAFRLSNRDEFKQLLEDAGFQDVQLEGVDVISEVAEAGDYARCQLDISSTLRALMSERPELESEVVRALERAARHFVDEDGRVRMANRAVVASARVG